MAKTTVQLGVVLLVNDQPVPLTPKQGGDLVKNGLELGLEQPLAIGTPGQAADGLEAFIKQFDSSYKLPKSTDLPDEISGIADKLSTVDMVIESFHLKVYGTKDAVKGVKPGTEYTFGMSAMWHDEDAVGLDGIPVKLKGAFFKISNEEPETP